MYTPDERAQLRSELIEDARRDGRISGAAITGSAAAEREDRWSDIDLAFGVAEGAELSQVLADWTRRMYEAHGAVHQTDVHAGPWIYRVFLLASTLQVDLAFVGAAEFRALAPSFRLVFGEAKEARHMAGPMPADLIGLGWLYALHARSAIARGKWWQAEYMISGVRDRALELACVRHGLPAVHGRGIDDLPAEAVEGYEGTLVRQLDRGELSRAFAAAVECLVREIRQADGELAARIEGTLRRLIETLIPEVNAAAGGTDTRRS